MGVAVVEGVGCDVKEMLNMEGATLSSLISLATTVFFHVI